MPRVTVDEFDSDQEPLSATALDMFAKLSKQEDASSSEEKDADESAETDTRKVEFDRAVEKETAKADRALKTLNLAKKKERLEKAKQAKIKARMAEAAADVQATPDAEGEDPDFNVKLGLISDIERFRASFNVDGKKVNTSWTVQRLTDELARVKSASQDAVGASMADAAAEVIPEAIEKGATFAGLPMQGFASNWASACKANTAMAEAWKYVATDIAGKAKPGPYTIVAMGMGAIAMQTIAKNATIGSEEQVDVEYEE